MLMLPPSLPPPHRIPSPILRPPCSPFSRPPAEPALFLVNPAGLLHVMVYSNASFARPDLKQIAQGGCWGQRAGGRRREQSRQAAAVAVVDGTCCAMCAAAQQVPVGFCSALPCPVCWCVSRTLTSHPLPCLHLPCHPPAGIKMVQDRKQPIRGTYY